MIAELDSQLNQIAELKAKGEGIVRQLADSLDQNWANNKLSVVPGDLVLDKLCAKYGVRFKKARDGLRIAALMEEHEIDEEMKRIIRELGAQSPS